MKVQAFIHMILEFCEQEDQDPNDLDLALVIPTSESSWGYSEDWHEPRIQISGDSTPRPVMLIK